MVLFPFKRKGEKGFYCNPPAARAERKAVLEGEQKGGLL